MSNSHDDDDVHKDLTRLEDLSEFLHEEDSDLENKFDDFKEGSKKAHAKSDDKKIDELEELPSLDDLEDADNNTTDGDSFSEFSSDETSFESSASEIDNEELSNEEIVHEEPNSFNLDELDDNSEVLNAENDESVNIDLNSSDLLGNDSYFQEDNNNSFDSLDEFETSEEEKVEITEKEDDDNLFNNENNSLPPIEANNPEKFEDVKNFVQNFSYGTIEGAGNPPFSVIIRNIQFSEDAEDIINILKELAVINDNNLNDYEKAIQLGSIIIPQISEFTAIIIAHKLRRFNLDLEVGLADEIHPSKSGENNPRGLTQKNQLKQNREEEFKPSIKSFTIQDILMTTQTTIDGYQVKKYMGIDHAHTFIDDEELERLHFINKGLRDNNASTDDLEHYKSYKDSFNKLHDELLDEIKNRAFKNGSNALLGIQFSMNQMADHKKSQYQLSCSATFAFVEKI